MKFQNSPCHLCKTRTTNLTAIVTERPAGETDFGIPPEDYYREVRHCPNCSVFNNFHDYEMNTIYGEFYNTATYDNELKKRFDKLMSLPPGKSDNRKRVKRIVDYCSQKNINIEGLKVLDIGSGLCVFLAEFQKYGIEAYCVDPDKNAVEHATNTVHVVRAFHSVIEDFDTAMKFDIVTLNKVLEHVINPIDVLSKVKRFLNDGGFIYLELPDGRTALRNQSIEDREEFYLEHYTVYDEISQNYLITKSNCSIIKENCIVEPSGKYTLYAFAK